MKNITLINQDSGYLMIDIANTLSNMDLDTSLIAGRTIIRNKPLTKYVKVRKIIKYQRNNKFRRILTWVIAFIQIFVIVKIKCRKDYLFIVSNPPITAFLPFFCRNRFSLMIFDVFPDILTQMGLVTEGSPIVRLWQKVNKQVYSRADNIFTLTEKMALLLGKYSSEDNITITPIWSDNEFFKPIDKSLNPFIIEHNLEDRFIVLYSGNLGATHNVEIIPELASSVQNPDAIFLIIGDGDRRRWLEEAIIKRGLKNCLLLPLQSVDKLPYSFASADLSIVSLSKVTSNLSVPSKTFNFMSAGLPLLCIAGQDSELNKIVKRYDNGKCFMPDQINEIVSYINEIAGNKELREHYKVNSLKASLDFTPNNVELIAGAIKNSMEIN